ncbi:MAG: NUDIX hydrolase [Actinomycetota bacterium]
MDTPRREVFAGRYVRVDVQPWREGEWETVRRVRAAGVLPVTPEGEVLLVRQFRPSIGRELTEIPAGLVDRVGEDARACAVRELREETGFKYLAIEPLGGYYSSAGFTDEYVHLFVAATELEPSGPPEEGIELVRAPFDEMVRAARAGRISDAKTALALLIAGARGPQT